MKVIFWVWASYSFVGMQRLFRGTTIRLPLLGDGYFFFKLTRKWGPLILLFKKYRGIFRKEKLKGPKRESNNSPHLVSRVRMSAAIHQFPHIPYNMNTNNLTCSNLPVQNVLFSCGTTAQLGPVKSHCWCFCITHNYTHTHTHTRAR